jgi:starch synthase
VYSVYNESLESNFNKEFFTKASINNLQPKDLQAYQNGTGHVKLHKGAIEYADALIQGEKKLDAPLSKEMKGTNKPTLGYQDADSYLQAYFDFYKELMN